MPEQISGPQQPESQPSSGADLGKELASIVRTGRDLDVYKKFFGPELGKGEELILDVGSGDSPMADEIAELTDHKAKVIRLDADFAETPPSGSEPAIAADAARMPFADSTFDRITSLWMMPHLGPDKGTDVMLEMLRVLKPEGRALLFPARPFKTVQPDYAEKVRYSPISKQHFPTLKIDKPTDYDDWGDTRKRATARELADYVTVGGKLFQVLKWGMAEAVEQAGTKRSVEQGRPHGLSIFGKKPPS